jgi:hypothetical protein
LRKEQRFDVVATPFTTPAFGNMLVHPKPTVGTSTVRDNPDGLVSHPISSHRVIEIDSITNNDDEPLLGELRQRGRGRQMRCQSKVNSWPFIVSRFVGKIEECTSGLRDALSFDYLIRP